MSKKSEDQPMEKYDPLGTLDVARGGSRLKEIKQESKALAEAAKSIPTDQLEAHLFGGNAHGAKERRALIKKQDKVDPPTKRQIRTRKPDRRTKLRLERLETKRLSAAVSAVQASEILQDQPGLIQPEHGLEKTVQVTQLQLKRTLDPNVARQIYDLTLPDAAYVLRYDRSGMFSLLAGRRRGHVAVLNNQEQSAMTEFHVGTAIRDALFLHNASLCAVAQRDTVYIYDTQSGAEVHRLENHTEPHRLEFLPYHFLLASVCGTYRKSLVYQDTSTGKMVAVLNLKLPTLSLRQDPASAVMAAGHNNGTVSLWSPAQNTFLAKWMAHRGSAITDIAIDGNTAATIGMDRQIRLWDLRMMYRQTHWFGCAAGGVPTSVDFSQRGLLAVGHGCHVTVYNPKQPNRYLIQQPYMHHILGPAGQNTGKGPVESVRFCPFEDVLGIGHATGVSSIVIPGSGEPTRDTSEVGFDKKHRREQEVKDLLNKVAPEMIGLDDTRIGGMEEGSARRERIEQLEEEANALRLPALKKKAKKRGKSKIQTQLSRKRHNIIDENLLKLRDAREKEVNDEKQSERNGDIEPESNKDNTPSALKRFF
jgi:U3 small nucleolar RNA-associated protein 7